MKKESSNNSNSSRIASIIIIIIILFGLVQLIIEVSINATQDSVKEKSIPAIVSKSPAKKYENTLYNYSINFPNDWELDPGQGNITQRAIKGNNVISISVRDVHDLLQANKNDLDVFRSIRDELTNSIGHQLPGTEVLEYSELNSSGDPLFWIKYSLKTNNTENIILEYHYLHENRLYSIRAWTTKEEFRLSEPLFKDSINSFSVH